MPDIYLTLTSGVALNGEVYRPGEVVPVDQKLARELIARGKALPATEDDVDSFADVLDDASNDELKDLAAEYGLSLGKKFTRAKWLDAIKAHEAEAAAAEEAAAAAAAAADAAAK